MGSPRSFKKRFFTLRIMPNNENLTEEVLYSSQHISSIPSHGDENQDVHWFPMRVVYGKVLLVNRTLEELGVEHYLALEEKIDISSGEPRVISVPIIDDLIFVRSTKKHITELKHGSVHCQHLRFITFIPFSELRNGMTEKEKNEISRIVVVPDAEMSQFFQAINQTTNHVTIIPYKDVFKYIGHKIRILQGPLAGCIGTLRRFKKNKHICIDCGGFLTAELGYMPKKMYEIID